MLRFVVHRPHWRSGLRAGLFQAMDEMLESQDHHLHVAVKEISLWFDANLPSPFSDEQKQNEPIWKVDPSSRAISWIKAEANEHVSKLYQLKALIEEAGWAVEELRTMRPGVILYEDDFQIVAKPYAETPR